MFDARTALLLALGLSSPHDSADAEPEKDLLRQADPGFDRFFSDGTEGEA